MINHNPPAVIRPSILHLVADGLWAVSIMATVTVIRADPVVVQVLLWGVGHLLVLNGFADNGHYPREKSGGRNAKCSRISSIDNNQCKGCRARDERKSCQKAAIFHALILSRFS